MRNQNPKIVEILDEHNLRFRCKKCGQVWSPIIKPDSGGKFYRGGWQCPNGCKPDKK
ncbi:hypothetical protein ES702_01305 [subsurface metagenome]